VSCFHHLRSSDPPLNPMECEKWFPLRGVVSVPSLDLSCQTLALLVISIPTWLWQPTMTHREGTMRPVQYNVPYEPKP
jgi:hypothetical protein